MNVFIVYAHPSEDSFTRYVRDEFIKGLKEADHNYEISDLYKMNFVSDMSESEYFRESNFRLDLPVPNDVLLEQEKINRCDALVFIYPVFWTDAPSKLVGWFDRVWTYGFAYGTDCTMKVVDKVLILATTGHSIDNLTKYGHLESMKRVMLGDRLFERAKESEMIFFDGMTKANQYLRESNWSIHLNRAYELGRNFHIGIHKT